MRVVATAGHVDHGKSSLILALTGTDPDRFPEEKARGLTIDLGFAFTELPSGTVVGFVDVPGHARFVKNMLAGVGAVEVALLVVAATEGWMAQTEEHTAILRLLGIRHGMVALTKADLVDDEAVSLCRLDIEERLTWPVVPVDSLSGRGLDDVRAALDRVLATAPPPADRGRPRLWVDRVFAARGAGTVVTGTLAGGALAVDEEVLVEPGHRRARVRGIESHHAKLRSAPPGSRVSLNLAGIDHRAITRGDAVVRPGQWADASTVDIALEVIAGHDFPRRGRLHVHVGSGEHEGSVRMLDAAFARVRLPAGLPLAPGDRVVLRSSARDTTIAGGEVLDVAPAARTADATARLALPLGARLMAARPWTTAAEVALLAGDEHVAGTLVRDGHAVAIGGWLVAPAALERVRGEARAAVAAEGTGGASLAALASASGIDAPRLRAALAGDPAIVVDHDVVRAAGPGDLDTPEARILLDALAAQPFNPPATSELGASPALVRSLARAGRLVDLDGVVLHADALDAARALIARAVVERGSITVADARDLLGSTRKYALPILRQMDAEGITRRRGDERVPGPRAASFARQ